MSHIIYFNYNKYVIKDLIEYFKDDKNISIVYKYVENGLIYINMKLNNPVSVYDFEVYANDIKTLMKYSGFVRYRYTLNDMSYIHKY